MGFNKVNVDNICYTLDSYFNEFNNVNVGKNIKSPKNKTIFLEEFGMIPNKWIALIYKVFTMHNNTIYMFGDPNQCEPVQAGCRLFYDYYYILGWPASKCIDRERNSLYIS